MNKKLVSTIFIALCILSLTVISQMAIGQTLSPTETSTSPTTEGSGSGLSMLLIVAIVVVVVAVAGGVGGFFVLKRKKVNEKSLKKVSAPAFEDWVIKRFNGKPSDPASGVNGFTEGGQPLLVLQSEHVSLPEVESFVKVLAKGKAEKGAIVAFDFEKDTVEGKMSALDNGIDLQFLRVAELLNKRFAKRINSFAQVQVFFDASMTYHPQDQVPMAENRTYERSYETMPSERPNDGSKPQVFLTNSDSKVAGQVKRMLDFLHYDYAIGDKEESTVPISENKIGVMKQCDCAIINIAAAEQERRYSGLYVLNPNIISEINAAYLKYNTQVILLVERKVDLPTNLKGLKRVEYDTDDLSFDAAMELNKALADFKKL
jgi:hypothetical protein